MRTSDSDTPKQVRRWFGCIINAAGSMNTTLNLANTWTLCHKRVSILQQLRYYEKKISPVPCFGASHHAIPKYNFSKLDVEYRWLMHTVVAPAWFSNGTSRNFGNAGDQHTRRGQRWNSIRRENVVPVGLWTLLYMIMMVGWVQMGRDFILSPWHNEWSLIFTQAILVQGSNFVLSAFPACPRVFVLCGIRRPSFKSKSVIPRNLVAKPLKDLLDTKWLPRSGMPQQRVLIGRISWWLWNRIFEDSWPHAFGCGRTRKHKTSSSRRHAWCRNKCDRHRSHGFIPEASEPVSNVEMSPATIAALCTMMCDEKKMKCSKWNTVSPSFTNQLHRAIGDMNKELKVETAAPQQLEAHVLHLEQIHSRTTPQRILAMKYRLTKHLQSCGDLWTRLSR